MQAHTLQGVAGNIGCRSLESAARELILAIKQQSLPEILTQKDEFCRVAKIAFDHLVCLLARWDQEGVAVTRQMHSHDPGPRNVNLDIIQELFDLLREGDPDVSVWMDALQDAVDLSASEVEERMRRLQTQVAEYDYDDALDTLQQLSDIYTNKLKSDSHGRA
jgi:HPt (histidine-containing phosphotransfer) domain-containing protein